MDFYRKKNQKDFGALIFETNITQISIYNKLVFVGYANLSYFRIIDPWMKKILINSTDQEVN